MACRTCLAGRPGDPVDPQWSVIHLRPPMGDRIIPEASHLGQPQEARGSCEWSGQLPNLRREVEKGAGLERATRYRLAFSSNVMGECQSLRRTDFAEEVLLGSRSWGENRTKENKHR